MRRERDIAQFGFGRRACVARCHKNGFHFGRLCQFPRQRVLAAAVADNE